MLMNSWPDFSMEEWSIFLSDEMNKLAQVAGNNVKYIIGLRDTLIYNGAKHNKKGKTNGPDQINHAVYITLKRAPKCSWHITFARS